MHQFVRQLRLVLLLCVSGAYHAFAQYSFDHQTNVFIGVINNGWPPNTDYAVGGNTSYDALLIMNGGGLFDPGGYMAAFSGSNNFALITGAGSFWNNSGILGVGWAGSGNTLVVSNGGRVINALDGHIGRIATSSNNSVLVTGLGSLWSNRTDVYIGYNGAGNSLKVGNGGLVVSSNGFIGGWNGSTNNTVLVTDPGSVWTNRGNLYFSYVGSSRNGLVISNGAQVFNGYGFVGGSAFSSSFGDSAVVSGSGSLWSNRFNLIVGYSGGSNSLMVTNGGRVTDDMGYLGEYYSGNNSAFVTGTGSRWDNQSTFYLGTGMGTNSLTIKNGGQVANGDGYAGYGGNGNQVLVADAGSVWSNGTNLIVGGWGAGNSLTISNGAQVTSRYGYIGLWDGGSNNFVTVAGSGSRWKNDADIWVGYNGLASSLIISNGAQVQGANLAVGFSTNSLSNYVLIDAGDLYVTNAALPGALIVGSGGQGTFVMNSGTVTADTLVATNGAGSVLQLNGGRLESHGSTIDTLVTLAIGDGARAAAFYAAGGTHSFSNGLRVRPNALLDACGVIHGSVLVEGTMKVDCGTTAIFPDAVTNYGRVEAANGSTIVFYGPVVNYGELTATNGTVRYLSTLDNIGTLLGNIRTGTNAWTSPSDGKWENAANWNNGTPEGAVCLVTNAGNKTITLDASTATLSPATFAISGLLLRAPAGSTNTLALQNTGASMPLLISSDLSLQRGGTLVVTDAAVQAGRIGAGRMEVDGEVLLSAAALIVTNGETLIGRTGIGTLRSVNANVSVSGTSLGWSNGSFGSLLLAGPGSTWNDSSLVAVGYDGAGSLVISNGGTLFDSTAGVGYQPTSVGNRVLITGSNSLWQTAGELDVGISGAGSSLTISNGGAVHAGDYAYVGLNSTAAANSVKVLGSGSEWQNRFFYLGFDGASNSLAVAAGGRIRCYSGMLGTFETSSNNSAVLTDPGSVWSNAVVAVGNYGSGNSLQIQNGATMTNGVTYVGYAASSSDNRLVVTTNGSLASLTFLGEADSAMVVVGEYGAGNNLTISDGGLVRDYYGFVGRYTGGSNNVARITGGGTWRNTELHVGYMGSSNSVVVNGGTLSAASLTIGEFPEAGCDNLVRLDSGSVFVTNSSATACLDVRGGKFIFAGGLLKVDNLIITNACGRFEHRGGSLDVTTLVLAPDLDADSDGLPNAWEQAYNLDPLNPLDANQDSDGDGESNLEEYLAGTNPTNGASCFRILSQSWLGNDLRVNWAAVGGRSYVVQISSAPGSGFVDLSPEISAAGSGDTITNYVHSGAATNRPARYYRVRLVP